jgi:hypothetical protein
MSGTLEFPTGGDGELTPALRDLYQAPADEAYWAGLEARILARTTGALVADIQPVAWWQVMGSWGRAGLVAAGLVALLAGAAAMRVHEAELQDQYEMVLEANPELATPMTVAIPGPRDMRERERRIRDLLEY